ncbi:DUF6719 family protein [Ensifer sp. BR816]
MHANAYGRASSRQAQIGFETCPPGQIKRLAGAYTTANIPRKRECIARPT